VVPTLKPVGLPLAVACRDSLSEQGRSVLEAASSGQVSPEQADRLLSAISKQARVVEIDELVRRVEALEDGD